MPLRLPNHGTGELLGKAGKLAHSTGDTFHTPNHPFASLSGNAALLEGKAPGREIYPRTEPSRTQGMSRTSVRGSGSIKRNFRIKSGIRPLPELSADIGMQG
jgi:hypothetical protein